MNTPDHQETLSLGTQAESGGQPATPGTGPAPQEESQYPLHRLAAAHGVGTEFLGFGGKPHTVADETLVKVLSALGVQADSEELIDAALHDVELAPWRRMVPPTVVVAEGETVTIPVHVPHGREVSLTIEREDGEVLDAEQQDVWVPPVDVDGQLTGRATFAVPADLPLGYHTLHASSGDQRGSGALIVVPARLRTGEPLHERRGWGLAAQLYSVRSKRSWGIGDLADLADLAAISGSRGADYVLVNPLHAAEPVPPLQPSPYSPSSRRFFNPLYIRVEAIAEFAYLKPKKRARVDELLNPVQKLNSNARRLDRNKAYKAKLEALELVFKVKRSPARQQALDRFCSEAGQGLDDFSLWSAIRESTGPDDSFWQDTKSAIGTKRVEAKRTKLAGRIDFHRWLQWICDEQLEDAQRTAKSSGMRLGVVHDLAVGVDHSSADAWTLRDVLTPGVSVGAPPDMYNQQGQDWGQPPWHPERLAEAGYRPFRDMLATVLRHAGGIRVDHILGLFRLWWIPSGSSPADGAYVRYDHDALVGVLALEAHRAGAVVIGEDLGLFEPWVQDYLASRGILGTSILWFEYDGDSPLRPEKYRVQALASVNTHDLPPTAGYLAGEHVALRSRLGLLERPEADERADHNATLAKTMDLLKERDLLPANAAEVSSTGVGSGDSEERTIEALHLLLAQTPSVLLGVSLVDAVGERRVQNQPGTTGALYPNWQVPLAGPDGKAVFLEDLPRNPRFSRLLAAVQGSLGTSNPDPAARRQ